MMASFVVVLCLFQSVGLCGRVFYLSISREPSTKTQNKKNQEYTQSEIMFSFFFQTDYDLYVNHMMASQSPPHNMVKPNTHNLFYTVVNNNNTCDMGVTFWPYFLYSVGVTANITQ